MREDGAECRQNGPADDQDREPERQVETEGQHFGERRRQRDEDRAQIDDLHRHDEHGEQAAGDRSGDEAMHQDPPGDAARRAADDRDAGAERDRDQRGMAERQHVDDDPSSVEHEEQADDREIDRDDAEDEADLHRALHRRARLLLTNAGGGGFHLHARFFAMRSPRIPCGRKISTMMSSVKAMRSRS